MDAIDNSCTNSALLLCSVYGGIWWLFMLKTYLMPLIKSEYVSRPIVEINTYLIQLVHINDYVFSNQTIGITVSLHVILILFTITLVRVVITIPGHVPNEWLDKIENEIR